MPSYLTGKGRIDWARIRQEVDLAAIVAADTRLSQGRKSWRGPCPLHHGDGPNFAVYRTSSGDWRWKCHSQCARGGDVIDYLTLKEGISVKEAVERVGHAPKSGTYDPSHWLSAEDMAPLSWERVERYERLVDLPGVIGQSSNVTGLDLWMQRGFTPETVRRFRLGACPSCPTAWDKRQPKKRWPSLTIPIWETDTTTGERKLWNVRHRLIDAPNGDKYRPDQTERGVHLWNTDSIIWAPDGSLRPWMTDSQPIASYPGQPACRRRPRILNLEGELKGVLSCQYGVDQRFPVISPSGGAGSWRGYYGEKWANQLHEFDIVHLFDPGAEWLAEEAARQSGSHGYWLSIGELKEDDWLAQDPARNVDVLLACIEAARPARSRSYWT